MLVTHEDLFFRVSTPNLSLLVCEFIRYQSSVFVGVLVCFGGSSRLRSVIGRTDERTLPKNERGSKNENPRSSNEVKQSDESNHPSLQNTKHRLSSFVTRHSSLSSPVCPVSLDSTDIHHLLHTHVCSTTLGRSSHYQKNK